MWLKVDMVSELDKITKDRVPVLLTIATLLLLMFRGVDAAEKRPNVVYILADDLGWTDVGSYYRHRTGKEPVIPTPNLNKLAAEGMSFMDAHTPAALCSPTRFSSLTGSNPYRSAYPWGVWKHFWESALEKGRRHTTVAEVMRNAGYRTAFVGKMHLGGDFYRSNDMVERNNWTQVDFGKKMRGLTEFGFDYTFVTPDGIQGPMFMYLEDDRYVPISQFGKDIPGLPDYKDSRIKALELNRPRRGMFGDSNFRIEDSGPIHSQKAIDFIDDHLSKYPDKPFLLYYSSPQIHRPHKPPKEFEPGKRTRGVTGLGNHADMIYEFDQEVGRILDKLADAGIADDTIIIFTSDNGGRGYDSRTDSKQSDYFREHEAGHDGTGGLKGRKGSIWEAGHRVPFIVKWGDGTAEGSRIKPGTISDQLISVNDWVATMYNLTGQDMEKEQAMDSESLLPVLFGYQDEGAPIHPFMIFQAGGNAGGLTSGKKYLEARAIREGEGVLIINGETGEPMEFYNLANDPGQKKNLINDAEVQERIKSMFARYETYKNSDSLRTTKRFTVSEKTQLPVPEIQ